MKDYARSFYKSKAWRTTQAAYMVSRHYVCERCGDVARVVHHKKHISPKNITNAMITLDWANLEALCHACHQKEHGDNRVCVGGLRFDERGDIVAVDTPRCRE